MNHYYDERGDRTRCGEYEGELAEHVSANDRVSCPDCRALLTPEEREDQWYPFTTDRQ